MLLFAHMGIGTKMVSPWSRELPKWALLFGTLLPDLIDKPLYYILYFLTQASGASMGRINNPRTVGHTAFFLLLITLIAVVRRSKVFAAIALGVATHLFLDNLSDSLADYFMSDVSHPSQHSALVALLWPFFKPYFSASPFNTLVAHLEHSFNPMNLGFEVVGAAILFWEYWQTRHEHEILGSLLARRRVHRERKRKLKNRR